MKLAEIALVSCGDDYPAPWKYPASTGVACSRRASSSKSRPPLHPQTADRSSSTQTPPQGQNYTRARVRRERMGGVSTFGATSH